MSFVRRESGSHDGLCPPFFFAMVLCPVVFWRAVSKTLSPSSLFPFNFDKIMWKIFYSVSNNIWQLRCLKALHSPKPVFNIRRLLSQLAAQLSSPIPFHLPFHPISSHILKIARDVIVWQAGQSSITNSILLLPNGHMRLISTLLIIICLLKYKYIFWKGDISCR